MENNVQVQKTADISSLVMCGNRFTLGTHCIQILVKSSITTSCLMPPFLLFSLVNAHFDLCRIPQSNGRTL